MKWVSRGIFVAGLAAIPVQAYYGSRPPPPPRPPPSPPAPPYPPPVIVDCEASFRSAMEQDQDQIYLASPITLTAPLVLSRYRSLALYGNNSMPADLTVACGSWRTESSKVAAAIKMEGGSTLRLVRVVMKITGTCTAVYNDMGTLIMQEESLILGASDPAITIVGTSRSHARVSYTLPAPLGYFLPMSGSQSGEQMVYAQEEKAHAPIVFGVSFPSRCFPGFFGGNISRQQDGSCEAICPAGRPPSPLSSLSSHRHCSSVSVGALSPLNALRPCQ
jgi:hypothetical protein